MEKPLTSVRRESMDLAGLLEEHGDHLLRLCTLYLGDRSQAEDAVQDTFLRALRAWPGFRGDCAVSGDVELTESAEDMIPFITVKLVHRDMELQPDSDGEMREISVDAVMELDIRLYEEEQVELLGGPLCPGPGGGSGDRDGVL